MTVIVTTAEVNKKAERMNVRKIHPGLGVLFSTHLILVLILIRESQVPLLILGPVPLLLEKNPSVL